ncbi:MAG TPA: fused MFS/spermidine synthase [Pyrinomonadaceae bacterium]|nr:fused MFS/spermidine synthase [Pyrinomonadaceae bacterium]
MASTARVLSPVVNAFYSPQRLRLIGGCFVLSGATGLIYEILWARMLGLVFGATTLAVSTVLAAFMGGLALGSALAGRFASRIKRPVLAYGVIEIGIALYALAVPFLFSRVDNIYALIWQQLHPGPFFFSVWRFSLSCLVMLIPTTLMGATLPVLSSALVHSHGFSSTSITRLYTRNLFGAICGTIAAGFFLLPGFGVRATLYSAAALNILIGIVAIIADRLFNPAHSEIHSTHKLGQPSPHTRAPVGNDQGLGGARFWLFGAFVSGFVTISAQVAWTRVLTMVIGSSTYAFTIVVSLFLLGLSAGAFVIGRNRYSEKLLSTIVKVELITAGSLYISLLIINVIPMLLVNAGLRLNVGSWVGLLLLQIVAAGLLILLPAFLLGTVMPLVLVWAGTQQSTTSVRLVGRSYAVNTVGAIAGAFCTGFILIPITNTRFTILFCAALCILVAVLAYQHGVNSERVRGKVAFGVAASLVLLLFVSAPGMNLETLSIGAYDSLVRVLARRGDPTSDSRTGPQNPELLMYKEGPTATVSVRRDWGITSLAINGRTNASDREDMPTQVMVGQLPLLLAPNTRSAMVVGFASGVSAGAMLQSPLDALDCIELEPAAVEASRYFEHVNHRPLDDPRLSLIIADARAHLRITRTRYDIIVSEPSHPWVPGVANLFTREFFELGREGLTAEGVFIQWIQIYQLSTESLRSILATYQKVFPHVMLFRVGGASKGKDLILAGSKRPLSLDRAEERMRDPRVSGEMARVGLLNYQDVKEWLVCDETILAPAVAGAVINTDDNMHVETTVPREAFLPLMQNNSTWLEQLFLKSKKPLLLR